MLLPIGSIKKTNKQKRKIQPNKQTIEEVALRLELRVPEAPDREG